MTQSTSPAAAGGFADLGIGGRLLDALDREGFVQPTPIQQGAIPPQLAGRDIVGLAQTGSGKTAAFTLPILRDLLARHEKRVPKTARALILAPTRELAVQIEETIRALSRGMHIATALVLGGVSKGPQVKRLAPGVDILVATPGRLVDLHNERAVDLRATGIVVLDEADRMLDMGFIRDVRRIMALTNPARRTALFSATMSPDIAELASSLLRDPVRVEVARAGTTVATIDQRLVRLERAQKKACLSALLRDPACERTIVFTRTKRGADVVQNHLEADGFSAAAIHGNKSQNARQRALDGFRTGDVPILVATDIAARGIDVTAISHVINFELPDEPETYVHRIGRTARNGATGVSITLCDPSERDKLRAVEKVTRARLAEMPLPPLAPLPVVPGRGRPAGDFAAGSGRRDETRKRAERAGQRPRQERPRQEYPGHGKSRQDRPANENPHQDKAARRPRRRRFRPGSARVAA